jgi:xanthine dehydrogenase accessory factor
MNLALLDEIEKVENGILATILETEGHTYKKKGEKALFAADGPFPLYGNLGSLCVDQEIVLRGREAIADGAPKVITIDTSDASDALIGTGTFCGGKLTMFVEPIGDTHKAVYREVRARLESGGLFYLIHDMTTGDLSLSESAPAANADLLIEPIAPFTTLFLFGATPLAQRLVTSLEESDFKICVIDWREDYLNRFTNVATIAADKEPLPFDEHSLILVLSHSYEKDKDVLKQALECRCTYIGLLSSKTRRDRMYEDLREDGITAGEIERVSSPVGLDIGARSDLEIAVSITAELIRIRNQ